MSTDSSSHSELFEILNEFLRVQPGEDLTRRYDAKRAQEAVTRLEERFNELVEQVQTLEQQRDLLQREADAEHAMGEDARRVAREVMAECDGLKEQLQSAQALLAEIEEQAPPTPDEWHRLNEQLESAQRVLAVADELASWCRVTTSVESVFSNNLGAQAQAQGMANLVVRYVAMRESYPAASPGS